MTKPKSKTPAPVAKAAGKPTATIRELAEDPLVFVHDANDIYHANEGADCPCPGCEEIIGHRPSDGTECTAGQPVPELPRIARDETHHFAFMQRLEAKLRSTYHTLLHDMFAWPGFSWPWPYRSFMDLEQLPYAVPLLAEREREAWAEVVDLTDELTNSYRQIAQLTERPEFHATLKQIVALASMFNGELVADLVQAVEGIEDIHKRTGVREFEVAASIKIGVISGDSGPVLDAEYQVQRKAQVVTKTGKVEGTINLGPGGQIIPAPEPWKGTPMGRVFDEAGKVENKAEAA